MEVETLIWLLRALELIAALYVLLIVAYTIGWYRLRTPDQTENKRVESVSVLVAARNEAQQIEQLLQDLFDQNYPNTAFELILIDDHSEDGTLHKAKDFAHEYPLFECRIFAANGKGKKAALSQALQLATGDLILVTDADCRLSPQWIESMVTAYHASGANILLGPVLLDPATTAFERIQVLEFMSLIGSTAGASGIGWPAMGNGANMAFERDAAMQVQAHRTDERLVSGDDVFLMEAFLKAYGKRGVAFVLDEEAIVRTFPQQSVKDFFRQRLRWVSKSRSYSSASIFFPAVIVFLFNFGLVALFTAAFFQPFLFLFYLLFILLKFLVDHPILLAVSSFMKRRHLLKYSFPLQLIYPFYVVFSVVAGNLIPVSWKGRK
jgi:cellulose synthase/poly-beta-1,6-N-acetylglucosamine synthase-like glycosyltransferase